MMFSDLTNSFFFVSFLYVLMPGVTAIQVMSLDAPGQATPLQTVDIAGPASSVGLSISAYHLSASLSPISHVDMLSVLQVQATCRA